MKMPSAIAVGSVAIALFAGGFAIGHGVHDDSKSSASKNPKVLGQVFARTPDSATSSTEPSPGAPPVSQAPSKGATQTTSAPSSVSGSTSGSTTATTAPTPVTTAVVPSSGDCGTGGAQATLSSHVFPQQRTTTTHYQTDGSATVSNGVTKAIQIDSLSMRLVFPDGSASLVQFNSAINTVVQPSQVITYSISVVTNDPPSRVELASFAFHTAGQPQCQARPV